MVGPASIWLHKLFFYHQIGEIIQGVAAVGCAAPRHGKVFEHIDSSLMSLFMNTLVLGAGVTGITTAYYLAKAGHKVTVIERQHGAALETSFANGGQISACHTEPWATPATLIKIINKPFMPKLKYLNICYGHI